MLPILLSINTSFLLRCRLSSWVKASKGPRMEVFLQAGECRQGSAGGGSAVVTSVAAWWQSSEPQWLCCQVLQWNCTFLHRNGNIVNDCQGFYVRTNIFSPTGHLDFGHWVELHSEQDSNCKRMQCIFNIWFDWSLILIELKCWKTSQDFANYLDIYPGLLAWCALL